MLLDELGIVVIGRNEGERLKTSIRSMPAGVPIIYVDSGSTDGSPEWVEEQGHAIVRLATDRPFSAARARNEGFERLMADHPSTAFVQFIDGDCELYESWLPAALSHMKAHPGLAVVAGLRRERFIDKSWYNELCAYEWDTPVGEADAVGGDAMYRTDAFREVGGFDPMMMAGEEPELCLRLRREGYKVERLDEDMTLHDAAIHTFNAWWKRAVRSGYAYTLGALKHGQSGYNVREVVRSLIWGAGFPALAVLAFIVGFEWLGVLLLALYPLKWVRVRQRLAAQSRRPGRYAFFLMLSNVAEARGFLRAILETAQNRRQILEYKS